MPPLEPVVGVLTTVKSIRPRRCVQIRKQMLWGRFLFELAFYVEGFLRMLTAHSLTRTFEIRARSATDFFEFFAIFGTTTKKLHFFSIFF